MLRLLKATSRVAFVNRNARQGNAAGDRKNAGGPRAVHVKEAVGRQADPGNRQRGVDLQLGMARGDQEEEVAMCRVIEAAVRSPVAAMMK